MNTASGSLLSAASKAATPASTPELHAEALEIFCQHNAGALYTPPALGSNIVRPGWSGGANFLGAAFDPDTGRFYVPSWAHFSLVRMAAGDPDESDLTIRPRVSSLSGPRRLPHRWQVHPLQCLMVARPVGLHLATG